MSTIICNYCESEIIKYNLLKHQKSETCIKIKLLLNKQKNIYEELLKSKINEYEMILKEKNNHILEYTEEEYTELFEEFGNECDT